MKPVNFQPLRRGFTNGSEAGFGQRPDILTGGEKPRKKGIHAVGTGKDQPVVVSDPLNRRVHSLIRIRRRRDFNGGQLDAPRPQGVQFLRQLGRLRPGTSDQHCRPKERSGSRGVEPTDLLPQVHHIAHHEDGGRL